MSSVALPNCFSNSAFTGAKGMTVIDNVDKAKFVAALAPVNAEFEKQFGKATLDKIRDVK